MTALRVLKVTIAAVWLLAIVAGGVALGAAWIAGVRLDVVSTSSMEPAIRRGSLAVMAPLGTTAIRHGDVVAFHPPTAADADHRVLHRVIEVIETDDGAIVRTRGDANDVADAGFVAERAVDGRLGFAVPYAGRVVTALQGRAGPLLLVGVPVLLLLTSELLRARRARAVRDDGKLGGSDALVAHPAAARER